MDADLTARIDDVRGRIADLSKTLKRDDLAAQVAAINAEMAAPNFWDDQESAQKTVANLQSVQATLKPLETLVEADGDLEVLVEIAAEDESALDELGTTLEAVESDLAALELKAIMSDPADPADAFLLVQAGEGGTDAADFAEMLMRMYQRWAETRGFKMELLDVSPGEEAGIRNCTLGVKGDYAFGYLKGESGNHRLVRNSPFDSAGRRQTSFAAVDVTPDLGDEIEIDIDWKDQSVIREDTLRASGAGGQHVNKTESAIRLTHLPTNTVVNCQSERSQHQNRDNARKMLAAKLYQLEVEKRDAENAARRGEKSRIGFGGQTIRHYVLNPDQYVKDSRTGWRGNPMGVLDGGVDPLIESYLKWSIGQGDAESGSDG
ncbi:MAG: peptide chain release factor 2 [Planctomycetota bacterium]